MSAPASASIEKTHTVVRIQSRLTVGRVQPGPAEGVKDPKRGQAAVLEVLDRRAVLREVNTDLRGIAGTADVELQTIGLLAGRWPVDLPNETELVHHIPRPRHVRGASGWLDVLGIARFQTLICSLRHGPFAVIQQQPRQRKQPEKQQEEQPEIEVQTTIPELERRFSGQRHT